MLDITATIKDSIVINNNIILYILDTHANQVKLGCVAPKNVKVDRKEIREKELAKKRNMPG